MANSRALSLELRFEPRNSESRVGSGSEKSVCRSTSHRTTPVGLEGARVGVADALLKRFRRSMKRKAPIEQNV